MSEQAKEELLGLQLDKREAFGIVNDVMVQGEGRAKPVWIACLNPHSYEIARRDVRFWSALKTADYLVPDGIGIVLASRLLGGSIRARVTGADVFEAMCTYQNANAGSCFFIGSSEEVLARIRTRMASDYPYLQVLGTYSPPFADSFSAEQNAQMRDAINSVKPDVLWVGLTAPKQEKWIAENLAGFDVCAVGAIGAVFDFYAGTVRRSPAMFRRMGLEWLPRLLQEPKRLWYRNFVSNPKFVLRVLLAAVFGHRIEK